MVPTPGRALPYHLGGRRYRRPSTGLVRLHRPIINRKEKPICHLTTSVKAAETAMDYVLLHNLSCYLFPARAPLQY